MLAEDPFKEPEMKMTQRQLAEYRIPLEVRDYCAHLLVPLNRCRYDNFFLAWTCKHEKHEYELCQHNDFMRRVNMKKEKKRLERQKARDEL
ncbi:NADH-ubiquinone oxidoreductase B18 subunit-domain-containing protein [Dimargaris cristalligena]|uniref:NADH dehydrogenase [ubiquinone] 1 beta subcomplex subunit 7 n=1 Tax=Dimargaris cristalligena TaxID=215637 RepID=A0A4P9ZMM3_9FUNG|nr:NADH-ubiquinone oxidoreductase B18 subunit-domain-containing protein [Dimargaris cristalligena]|eukprot:RKP34537.1 NADH-ubiquinone oxidoreductase B18 subunit-domain-containing protein [Dimargaris cristalligena]